MPDRSAPTGPWANRWCAWGWISRVKRRMSKAGWRRKWRKD